MRPIDVAVDDFVLYDGEGYETIKRFLVAQGIEHVLVCGYHADMCVCSTAAGYENLRKDFNVFLVGDAVQATQPANKTARFATNQAVSFASLKVFITQVSWVRPLTESAAAGR
jgi:nicotinamidase-related amidase